MYGNVMYGMVWFGMVWDGMVCMYESSMQVCKYVILQVWKYASMWCN